MMEYTFIGKPGKYRIPHGAVVRVVRNYPKRRVMVEYNGEKILTFVTLLRKRVEE